MLKKVAQKFGLNTLIDLPLRQLLKINKQMKKIALVLVIGAVALMSSCGPSAKEKEAKRIADSTRVADSIAHQDSIKKHLIKPAKKAAPAKKAHKK